jgi:hypothetical protein
VIAALSFGVFVSELQPVFVALGNCFVALGNAIVLKFVPDFKLGLLYFTLLTDMCVGVMLGCGLIVLECLEVVGKCSFK